MPFNVHKYKLNWHCRKYTNHPWDDKQYKGRGPYTTRLT